MTPAPRPQIEILPNLRLEVVPSVGCRGCGVSVETIWSTHYRLHMHTYYAYLETCAAKDREGGHD